MIKQIRNLVEWVNRRDSPGEIINEIHRCKSASCNHYVANRELENARLEYGRAQGVETVAAALGVNLELPTVYQQALDRRMGTNHG